MKLRLIRKVLSEHSLKITGSHAVIILRIMLDILDSGEPELKETRKSLADRFGFAAKSVALALESSEMHKIFSIRNDGGVGVQISIHKDMLTGE
jgi:hypothetical protein